MRDDDLRRVLTDANPWWRAASFGTDPLAWIDAHRLLIDRAEHDLGYRASVLDDIASNPRVDDRLVVLTGPRRVGKSVALLDVAAVLCGRPDIDPRQVIHLPCDGFARPVTMSKAIFWPAGPGAQLPAACVTCYRCHFGRSLPPRDRNSLVRMQSILRSCKPNRSP